jgi:hypothetical protein
MAENQMNPDLFKGKKKTKAQLALKYGKKYGLKALKVISYVNPYARVATGLYKVGRLLYLRKTAKTIKDISKRTSDIGRTRAVLGPKTIVPAKGKGKVVQGRTGTKYVGLTRPIATEVKRPRTVRLLPQIHQLPKGGGTMKSIGGPNAITRPTRSSVLTKINRLRKISNLKRERAVGLGLKVGITSGGIAGVNQLRQPSKEQLKKQKQADMIKNIKLDKKKYKDKYGLTDLQYDLIMENLRNNQ